jgi:hypothetical protein
MRLRIPSVDLVVGLLVVAACVCWALAAGKDMNWDQLSYHYYAGLAATSDRLDQDFFAASIQSYLNPYAYLPFFWMVQADLPPALIGGVLAALHSVNLILVYAVAKRLVPPQARYASALRIAAVATAGLAPIFLYEVGSTFIDIVASIPVVAALAALLYWPSRPWLLLGGAGALLGAAIALKMTNLIFAPALVAGVLCLRGAGPRLFPRLLATGAGLATGFLLVGGGWSYTIYREFGNPFFPFFNAWFQSPDYLPADIRHHRYLPDGITEILTLPFRMVLPTRDVYTELYAPDARFAIVVLLLSVLAARRLMRGQIPSLESHSGRQAFLVACAVAFVLWLLTSGNGRYLMPVICLVGPVTIWLLREISDNKRWLLYGVSGLLAVQIAGIVIGAEYRWDGASWNTRWFNVDIPNELRSQPGLYVSVSNQPAAFLAPMLHADAGFVNAFGQNPLSLQGPGGERLAELLERHRDRTWILFDIPSFDAQGEPRFDHWEVHQSVARAIGLDSVPSACRQIRLAGLYSNRVVDHPAGAMNLRLNDVPYAMFVACKATRTEPPAALVSQRERADDVFTRIEALCPRAFQPAGGATVPIRLGEKPVWVRMYVNTDLLVRLEEGRLYVRGYRFPWRRLGSAAGLDERGNLDCPSVRLKTSEYE